MNPESIYLSHLPTIERIAAFVTRRGHLGPDETAEFVQLVRAHLFEDDYAIIRRFPGRSSFATYLTTVILRLFAQWRVEQWGKWRPSAEAKRMGDLAVTLERLINRDGFTFDEAAKTLTSRPDLHCTVEQLESLYLRLSARNPRPGSVSSDEVPIEPAPEMDAADLDSTARRRDRMSKIGQILDDVISRFDPEDQMIMRLRFWDAKKVPEIARIVGIDQKKIYKRLDRLFAVVRRALEQQSIGPADLDALLAAPETDDELTIPSLRTIKSADLPGIYIDPATARRTLEEVLREKEPSGRK